MQIFWAILNLISMRFLVAYLNYHPEVLSSTAFLYGIGLGGIYVFGLMALAKRDCS
jgi:hypothetical protein